MKNLYRDKQIIIRITEEEKELFEEKLRKSGIKNMSLFIRKCVLEKNIYVIDLAPFYKIQELLANESNNINQIAKRVNSTGVIYKNDIEDMKKMINTTSYNVLEILNFLMNLEKK